MSKQGLFKSDMLTRKELIMTIHHDPLGYNYRLSPRVNGEKIGSWGYTSKIPLPIEKLQSFLDTAYDDMDTLKPVDYQYKFSTQFNQLEYITALTYITGYPTSWADFVKVAVNRYKVQPNEYNLFLDMLVRSDGVQQRAIWAWECAKPLVKLHEAEGAYDVDIITAVIDLTLFTLMYEISGKEDPQSYQRASILNAELISLGAEYIARYFINQAWTGVRLLNMNENRHRDILKTIYKVWGIEYDK